MKMATLAKTVCRPGRVNNTRPLSLRLFQLLNRRKERFECPICAYAGPFLNFHSPAGNRKHARCPGCGAMERHRLQYLAAARAFRNLAYGKAAMLHFAPEPFLKRIFAQWFSRYDTADLLMERVDYRVDAQRLPFKDATYDVVFASHVLEHIRDDRRAIREIRRVLRPAGIAILPVPIVSARTIEYPDGRGYEAGHVRAPGPDYFERFAESFAAVDVQTSESFPEKYQLFTYEDRSVWPTRECPLRLPMPGYRHPGFVPICYV